MRDSVLVNINKQYAEILPQTNHQTEAYTKLVKQSPYRLMAGFTFSKNPEAIRSTRIAALPSETEVS